MSDSTGDNSISRFKQFPGTPEDAASEVKAVDQILDDLSNQMELAFHAAKTRLIELGHAALTEEGFLKSATGYFRAESAHEGAVRAFIQSGRHPLEGMAVPMDPAKAAEFLNRSGRDLQHREKIHALQQSGEPVIHLQLPCCEVLMAVEDLKEGELTATHVLTCSGCLTDWFVKVEWEQLTLKDAAGQTRSIPLRRA